ncbi:uncharacterized protein LOC133290760 [Gastrolobium bilobum]|uniref:uncharacterized protein LOC133290760 n=1 Tax=Gastrolobium bilobum TaxID=150636 RepID=UPI002AB11309|nr:uncharacterized protein LOC133290760 [Gastrolobium bilobum]
MEFTSADQGTKEPKDLWKVYVDGSSNAKGNRARIILESPEGVSIEHSLYLNFPTSNNQAEYKALIAELIQVKEHGTNKVKVFSDSQLVTSQIDGKYQAKGPLLMKYLNKVKEIITEYEEVKITHIPRGKNSSANILSKLASTKNPDNHRTVVQHSITEPSYVKVITLADDWRQLIIACLEIGTILEDSMESKN